jgi:hypothetical protein
MFIANSPLHAQSGIGWFERGRFMGRWGICLLTVAILISGGARAQVAGDPDAAAPIVYSSSAPPDEATAATSAEDESADAEDVETAPDDVDDDDGVYSDEPTADFYPGVSLLPVDYWDPTFGWTYFASFGYGYGYAWPTFGFGWPYWGLSWYGGGYWHHHHRYASGGHHHHGGWDRYQFHYNGRGRYADHHGTQTVVGGRPNPARGTTAIRDRASPNASGTGLFVPRATLRSASYVAAQRGQYSVRLGDRSAAMMPSRMTARDAGTGRSYRNEANSRSVVVRGANPSYRATAMPRRGYATSPYRGNPTMRYATPTPRGGYAAPHYSGNYSAARSTTPAAARPAAHTSSSGGHSSGISTRQH